MLMRDFFFLVAYSAVGCCVAFTMVVAFGLPAYLVSISGFFWLAIVDRVGQGFGVSPILRRNERTDVSAEVEVQNSPR